MDETPQVLSEGERLCIECGLCCSGHLFIWAKLRPREMQPAKQLGFSVFWDGSNQRGFLQPCPQLQQKCKLYGSEHYPHACRAYNCKALKALLNQDTTFAEASRLIEAAKLQMSQLEPLLPALPSGNFRERLVAVLESRNPEPSLLSAARAVAELYEHTFGVTDLLEDYD